MFSHLIRYLYGRTRPEFHSALTVLVFTGAYALGYCFLWAIFPLFDKKLVTNFELAGYFVGCIGAGELARGIAKLTLSGQHRSGSLLTNSIAGSVCIGVFWTFMVFKWQYELWGIPVAFLVGAIFYLLLNIAQKIDNKFGGNS